MVVMIRRVGGVEVVEEGEGAEVEGKAEKGGVIGIEDTVGEGIRLPGGDGQGVTAGDFTVEAGETVLFGTGGTLDHGLGNRTGWFEGSDIERSGLIEDGWKRRPSFVDMLGNVGCQCTYQSSVASGSKDIERAYSKP